MEEINLVCDQKEKLIMCILSDDYTIMNDCLYLEFNLYGYNCLIIESSMGCSLGYIDLEKEYEDEFLYEYITFEITYNEKTNDNKYRIGFDNGHSYDDDDLIPFQERITNDRYKLYRYNFKKAFLKIKSTVELLKEKNIR